MSTIFDIEQKQDSAEKLAAIASKPTNEHLFAGEWNAFKEVALQNLIDNLKLSFYWGKNDTFAFESPFIGQANKLGVHINNSELFANCEVKLFIDRYRPKRTVKLNTNDLRYSGYKHEKPNEINLGRKTEISIATNNELLNFGQETYFKTNGSIISATGFSSKADNHLNTQAQIFLQFRLVVAYQDKIYESKPLGRLKMFCTNKTGTPFIGYKL